MHKVCIYVAGAERGVWVAPTGTAPFRRGPGRTTTTRRVADAGDIPGGVELHTASARGVAHGVKRTAGEICRIHRSEASLNAQIRKKKNSRFFCARRGLQHYDKAPSAEVGDVELVDAAVFISD